MRKIAQHASAKTAVIALCFGCFGEARATRERILLGFQGTCVLVKAEQHIKSQNYFRSKQVFNFVSVRCVYCWLWNCWHSAWWWVDPPPFDHSKSVSLCKIVLNNSIAKKKTNALRLRFFFSLRLFGFTVILLHRCACSIICDLVCQLPVTAK